MSQYQEYSNPGYPQHSQYPQHSSNSYNSSPQPQQNYTNMNSYPAQTTSPPQSYNSPRMEQPQPAYQAPQQMSEKPQMTAQAQAHNHNHNRNGFGNKWLFGLFDCCSPLDTCCLGFWCSCFLFGRTYAREHGEGETSGCSGMCCLWYCAASVGFNSCLQCVMRGQQREKHGIEGSTVSDFCASFWCPCCTLMQEEKESIVRNTGIDPTTKVAYQPIGQGMNYPA